MDAFGSGKLGILGPKDGVCVFKYIIFPGSNVILSLTVLFLEVYFVKII